MRRVLRDDSVSRPIADINMTNLVDVTLTLLVLFILIAPVIDQGFSLELPTAVPNTIRTVDSLTVAIDSTGSIQLEGRTVTLLELGAGAVRAAERSADTDVVILADRTIPYGRVVEVMDAIRSAGLSKLSLATSEGVR